MPQSITLEQVVSFAESLSMQDQLKLMARVSEHLSRYVPNQSPLPHPYATDNVARLRLAEELLLEVEEVPDDAPGMLDATEAIRQMRQERHR